MTTFRFRHQLGLSLVELMVALAVSTILLGGVIQIFVSSKMSYRLLDGYSRLQENGRFAVDVLSRNIRLAGYQSDIWSSEETVFPLTTSGDIYASNGQVVIGTDGCDGELPDCITFRYQVSKDKNGNPDRLIKDCLGGDDGYAEDFVSMTFRIDLGNNANELECQVDDGNFQPLVDGVENMQILYGVDTSNPPNRFANTFVNAGQVTANGDWVNVVSVRIALLLNTVNNVSTQNDSQNYTLLSGANAVNIAAADNRLRRHRFMTTINLRNRVRLP